jgi:hypothetical protein
MVLSNAERQRRYRERLKARAAGISRGACLTPEQVADRNAVASEPLHPVPSDISQVPTFMGWNRYEWASAPDALVEHFDLTDAVNGWRAERAQIDAQVRILSQRLEASANAIIEECGERAREIARERGYIGLISAYEKDPSLGQRSRRRRVT